MHTTLSPAFILKKRSNRYNLNNINLSLNSVIANNFNVIDMSKPSKKRIVCAYDKVTSKFQDNKKYCINLNAHKIRF